MEKAYIEIFVSKTKYVELVVRIYKISKIILIWFKEIKHWKVNLSTFWVFIISILECFDTYKEYGTKSKLVDVLMQ